MMVVEEWFRGLVTGTDNRKQKRYDEGLRHLAVWQQVMVLCENVYMILRKSPAEEKMGCAISFGAR